MGLSVLDQSPFIVPEGGSPSDGGLSSPIPAVGAGVAPQGSVSVFVNLRRDRERGATARRQPRSDAAAARPRNSRSGAPTRGGVRLSLQPCGAAPDRTLPSARLTK